jgi:cell division inhibitor SepF
LDIRTGLPSRRERSSRLRSVDSPSPAVHLVVPRTFNDAKQIADRFKAQIPVILNLQGADTELSKRLIDFASGLTYALDGSMQRVADKVFLLTPRDVELSAEERARAMERGGFFNQA